MKNGTAGSERRLARPAALYDRIGKRYDRTRRADPGIARTLNLLLGSGAGGRYLDVACGTGNYTVALAECGGRFFGVDPSSRMLAIARRKRSRAVWLRAAAEALPFPDSSFDGALCVMGIHHLSDKQAACAEVARVLGRGRFVLFTSTREQMEGFWLRAYFPRAMGESMERMPSRAELLGTLSSAGLTRIRTEPYDVPPDIEDLFLYAGKHRPTLYLDPQVRSGMSTFAACSDPREVRLGCAQLAADCQSGRIQDLIAAQGAEGGDYLFVVAERGDQT